MAKPDQILRTLLPMRVIFRRLWSNNYGAAVTGLKPEDYGILLNPEITGYIVILFNLKMVHSIYRGRARRYLQQVYPPYR